MEIFLNWLLLVSIFSLALTSPGPDFVIAVKQKFLKFTKWIDRVCGGFLIALSVKLALTKAA